ncbi:MAG: hypothetical protein ACYTE8_00690 [Planctomycetota bacterium]|jgi:hypothetical protein
MKDSENNNQNGKLDDDILQGKEDVLRAKDIIPASPESQLDETSTIPLDISEETHDETAVNRQLLEEEELEKEETDIPQFDLAEKILTDQRKLSAIRRKAPVQNEKQQKATRPRSKRYIFKQSTLASTAENKLISQIVARDIKRLSRTK